MMIRTYIRVELSSEGESPKQVIDRMRKIGAVPVVGDYDFELPLGDDQRLFDRLEEIHHTLRGANVRYTVTTRSDSEIESGYSGRTQITHYVDQKPLELKKSLYKAKLERWKEMGLDVADLEILLEEDLDKFKAASKEFLRTHLDRLSIVQDKRPQENRIDGEILALLDEEGKTLAQIAAATGYFEDQVTLSLGRLISSGSARREPKDSTEIFCLIPPPAPQMRKAIEVVPAKDEDEAKARAYEFVPIEGTSSKDLVKSAKLPREQLKKALESLSQEGKIRVERRGKKDWYFRV
jgi:hypothetical protein